MFGRVALTALTAIFLVSCAAEPEPVEPPAAEPQAAEPQAPEWQVRIDESVSAADPDNTPDIEFTPTGATGFQYVGGPAGTLWMPGQTASGDYTLSATFTQNEPASHTTFYGLVFGGNDLGDPTQRYLYFQVAQNGTFLIKERTGDDTADLEGGETEHAAVQTPPEGGLGDQRARGTRGRRHDNLRRQRHGGAHHRSHGCLRRDRRGGRRARQSRAGRDRPRTSKCSRLQ